MNTKYSWYYCHIHVSQMIPQSDKIHFHLTASKFFTPGYAGGLLLESECQCPPEIPRNLHCILADQDYVVIWKISILPLIFNSSNLFPNSFDDSSKHTDYNFMICSTLNSLATSN